MERATRVIDLPSGPVEYRLDERGPHVVLMLHGGHMRAGLPLGEDVFADADYTILAPSRPGYGRTPLTTDTSPEGFADALAELLASLSTAQRAMLVELFGRMRSGAGFSNDVRIMAAQDPNRRLAAEAARLITSTAPSTRRATADQVEASITRRAYRSRACSGPGIPR